MNLIIPATKCVEKPTENPFRNHYYAEDVNSEFVLDQFGEEEIKAQLRKISLQKVRPFTTAFAIELSNARTNDEAK